MEEANCRDTVKDIQENCTDEVSPLQDLKKHLNEPKNDKGFIKKIKHDRTYRGKNLYSASMWCIFLVFGWKVGQLGPSLLDLQVITGTSLDKISAIFTSGAIGYLGGTFFSAYLFRNFNSAVLLFISAIGSAVIMVIIPWCFRYETMLAAFAVVGVFDAMTDTVSNAELFRIWRTESTLYIQTLHLFFTIGATISPSVTAPFLIPLTANMTDNSTMVLPLNESVNSTLGNNGTKFGLSKGLYNTSTDGILPTNETEHISIFSNENIILERH